MKLFPVDVPRGSGDNARTIFGMPAPYNLGGRKNLFGTDGYVESRKKPSSTSTPSTLDPKFGELWSANNRVIVAHIDQPKRTFFGRIHFGH